MTIQTVEFVREIAQDADVFSQFPEVFVDQARAGLDAFEVTADMVSASLYSRGPSKPQFNIVVIDPILKGEEILIKLQVRGIIHLPTGDMSVMSTGSSKLKEDEQWLKGFRSGYIAISPEDVKEGFLTQSDYDALVAYAESWQLLVDEGANLYSKEYAKHRLWLSAASADFLFTFQARITQNPNTGEDSIGIQHCSWKCARFIGVTAQVTEKPGIATRSKGTPVDIEVPARMFGGREANIEVPRRGTRTASRR